MDSCRDVMCGISVELDRPNQPLSGLTVHHEMSLVPRVYLSAVCLVSFQSRMRKPLELGQDKPPRKLRYYTPNR